MECFFKIMSFKSSFKSGKRVYQPNMSWQGSRGAGKAAAKKRTRPVLPC